MSDSLQARVERRCVACGVGGNVRTLQKHGILTGADAVTPTLMTALTSCPSCGNGNGNGNWTTCGSLLRNVSSVAT
ncbi:hypothetical protein ACLKA6_017888 [Drosophila palustris]